MGNPGHARFIRGHHYTKYGPPCKSHWCTGSDPPSFPYLRLALVGFQWDCARAGRDWLGHAWAPLSIALIQHWCSMLGCEWCERVPLIFFEDCTYARGPTCSSLTKFKPLILKEYFQILTSGSMILKTITFGIANGFTKYVKESCWLCSD